MQDGSNTVPSPFHEGSSVPYSEFEAAQSKAMRLPPQHRAALLGDVMADMPTHVALDFSRWEFTRVVSTGSVRFEWTPRALAIRAALQAAQ